MLAPGGNNHQAFFVEGMGGGVVAPLTTEEVGGGGWQATPTSAPWPRCAMGRHCRGPACKSMLGLRCQRAPFWW